MEGKEYIAKDGDIFFFRFNVWWGLAFQKTFIVSLKTEILF
jgi:hypothetical protein